MQDDAPVVRGRCSISNRCLLLGLFVVCLCAGLTYVREVGFLLVKQAWSSTRLAISSHARGMHLDASCSMACRRRRRTNSRQKKGLPGRSGNETTCPDGRWFSIAKRELRGPRAMRRSPQV